MIKSEICEILGIRYPVFQGGMAWIADGKLAAAVSNGGGLGIIAAGNATGEYIQEQIKIAKALTDKPIGVNIMLLSPFADEVAKVMRMCLPVCFVMFGGIFLLGEQVINWMYGPQYDGAYTITLITMFGVCAHMFYNMIEVYNIVQKKQNVTLMVVIGSALFNVAVNAILIPRYSAVGAGIATTISFTCSALVCMVYFSRKTHTKFGDMLIIKKADIKGVKALFSKSGKEQNNQ